MTNMDGVYLIGSGGLAKLVLPILRELELRLLAVFDDDPQAWCSLDDPTPVVGPIDSIRNYAPRPTILAIGDNAVRSRLAGSLSVPWFTLLDPRAIIDRDVQIGEGTIVSAGVVLQANARIGRNVYISACASVSHDCFIGDYAHLAPGCRVTGGVTIGEGVLVGAGATVVPGKRVGSWTTIGASAAVVNDLPDGVVAVGVPARIMNGRSDALAHPNVRDRLTSDCDFSVPLLQDDTI